MKIEVTGEKIAKELIKGQNNCMGISIGLKEIGLTGDKTAYDLTDLVMEQLKVKVPDEMPWEVWEIVKTVRTKANLDQLITESEVLNWIYALNISDSENEEREFIVARAYKYGAIEEERKFRIPLKGLTVYGRQEYICYDKENKEFWATDEYYEENSKGEFTEAELKKLKAPSWIMQLTREYVDENGEVVNEKN